VPHGRCIREGEAVLIFMPSSEGKTISDVDIPTNLPAPITHALELGGRVTPNYID
jgi:hypothetical protein